MPNYGYYDLYTKKFFCFKGRKGGGRGGGGNVKNMCNHIRHMDVWEGQQDDYK